MIGIKYSGINEEVLFNYIKENQSLFQTFYEQNKWMTLTGYFIVYVAVTSLSIPAATVLTLLGSAIFGFFYALLLVSFASTIGATFAFLISRYFLRDLVHQRYQKKLAIVNEGIERDGAFYLFSLRLIPVVPFFFINLSMGLTKMPLKKYYWVSQLAMLPWTLLYINAGLQLGKLESLSDIVSWEIALSFAMIGVFPWISKILMNKLKNSH